MIPFQQQWDFSREVETAISPNKDSWREIICPLLGTSMKRPSTLIAVCALFLMTGCVERFRFAEFTDENERNYRSIFRHPPEGIDIEHSHVTKYVTSWYLKPRQRTPEEWDTIPACSWAFEMTASQNYITWLQEALKLQVATERHRSKRDCHGPPWYPEISEQYRLYSRYIDISTQPYWEMIIDKKSKNPSAIHFYVRRF